VAEYDRIARYYRLLYADWEQSATRQSTAIGALLAKHGVAPGASVLDCSCGIDRYRSPRHPSRRSNNLPVYDFELFLLIKKGRRWKTVCLSGRYRAYTRAELTDAFQGAGFSRSGWLMPEETGYFQPVMIAHKGG
jgi:hypothetical protein